MLNPKSPLIKWVQLVLILKAFFLIQSGAAFIQLREQASWLGSTHRRRNILASLENSLVDEANAAIERGQLDRAESLLLKARAEDPNRDLPSSLYRGDDL